MWKQELDTFQGKISKLSLFSRYLLRFTRYLHLKFIISTRFERRSRLIPLRRTGYSVSSIFIVTKHRKTLSFKIKWFTDNNYTISHFHISRNNDGLNSDRSHKNFGDIFERRDVFIDRVTRGENTRMCRRQDILCCLALSLFLRYDQSYRSLFLFCRSDKKSPISSFQLKNQFWVWGSLSPKT